MENSLIPGSKFLRLSCYGVIIIGMRKGGRNVVGHCCIDGVIALRPIQGDGCDPIVRRRRNCAKILRRCNMNIRPANSEQAYDEAIERIETLWGAESGTPEGDELDVLLELVRVYERESHPVPDNFWFTLTHELAHYVIIAVFCIDNEISFRQIG